ncbi:adenosine receptor A1-like [Montipora capricornis]|uniref:adenosine receptor A1-like n=1 Tax=Montipora capricornis TaxID=246305 RepID=UPI0035F156E7
MTGEPQEKKENLIMSFENMFDHEGESQCASVKAPTSLSLFTAAMSFLFSIVTVPCNILVCFTIMKSSSQFKCLRTPFTHFIFNLAVTDLLVGALTEPVSVAYHITEAFSVSSPQLVRILQVLYFLPCTVSVLSILALTLERCYAISKPFEYRTRVNGYRVFLAAGIIWLLSPVFLAPYFVMGYRAFSFLFANVIILVSVCVLACAYLKIIRTLYQGRKFRKENLQSLSTANQKATLLEDKLTSTFILILILFAVCYITPCLLMYIMNLCAPSQCSCHVIHWLRDTSFLAVTLNSAINPLLYAWRLPSFRRALSIVISGLAGHEQPS